MNLKFLIRLFLVIIYLSLFSSLKSQTKALSLNDRIPDLKLNHFVNAPFSTIQLSQFIGKVLILDFWNTHCGACIKEIPIMAQLQIKFKGRLEFVMITPEEKQDVETFYKKRPELKNFSIPTIVNDTILSELFPYDTNPHLVWIGVDGVVKAITGGEYLTEENIIHLLKTNEIDLPIKNDWLGFEYYSKLPLLLNGEPIIEQIISYSTLTNSIPNLTRGTIGVETQDSDFIKVRAINQPLLNLYRFAYSPRIKLSAGNVKTRTILNLKDALPQIYDSSGNLKRFCYELSMKRKYPGPSDKIKLLNYMRDDLDRSFGIESSIKTVSTACYVLFLKDSSLYKDINQNSYSISPAGDFTQFSNVPVSVISGYLQNCYPFTIPVIYEGPLNRQVTIMLKKSYSSLENLTTDLTKGNFSLTETTRNLDMLFLSDK